MAMKFFVLAATLAICRAAIVAQPVAYPAAGTVVDSEYDANPQYSYAYDVQDPFTGDSKSQVESRSGDVVRGQYSLNDPDGTRRTVDYTADPINGFNAVVKKSPLVQAVAAPAVVHSVPVIHSNNVVSPVVANVANVDAVTHVAYAAPVAHQVVNAPFAYTGGYAYPYAHGAYSLPYVRAHYY